jgi:hypothetical protein
MTLSRALQVVFALAALSLWPATAQEALPDRSGSPGAMQQPSSACLQLRSRWGDLWSKLAPHHRALLVASENGTPPSELCALYQPLLATGSDLVEGLEKHRALCGIPAESLEQLRVWHGKVSQLRNRVCGLAIQPSVLPLPKPTAPQCFATALPRLSCVFADE